MILTLGNYKTRERFMGMDSSVCLHCFLGQNFHL